MWLLDANRDQWGTPEAFNNILKRFHVIVLSDMNFGDRGKVVSKGLRRYLAAGGGVLVNTMVNYGPDKLCNEVTEEYGAVQLSEMVRDPQNIKADYYPASDFAAHPITAGIVRLWVPADKTFTARYSDNWTVLARADRQR